MFIVTKSMIMCKIVLDLIVDIIRLISWQLSLISIKS